MSDALSDQDAGAPSIAQVDKASFSDEHGTSQVPESRDVLELLIRQIEVYGAKAFPCSVCRRDGTLSTHQIHEALASLLARVRSRGITTDGT